MVLKVFRWSPGFRERIQRFWVPAKDGMTVLDALVDAQRRLDPTLAFRYACRVGMCGSCGMVINGRERWACRTLLKSLGTRIVTVRPLYPAVVAAGDSRPLPSATGRRLRGSSTVHPDGEIVVVT
jgi:fumarate reductase iron-sulfur subunit